MCKHYQMCEKYSLLSAISLLLLFLAYMSPGLMAVIKLVLGKSGMELILLPALVTSDPGTKKRMTQRVRNHSPRRVSAHVTCAGFMFS